MAPKTRHSRYAAVRRDYETTGPRDYETTGLRDNGTTGRRDHGTTGRRDDGTTEKHRRSQAFSGILSRARLRVAVRGSAWQCVAVRYRAWLIREFREIKEFRDVRAMPATNQVSDVVPLNRAARSRASLNSLISLNSLLTARYHHAPKRDEFLSEGVRCGAIPKDDWMGVYLGVHPHSGR